MYKAVWVVFVLLVKFPITEFWLLADAPPVNDGLLTAGISHA